MSRPRGIRIAEVDLSLLEVAAVYSMLCNSERKQVCLLDKGGLCLAYTGQEREG